MSSPRSTYAELSTAPEGPSGLPRLLAGIPAHGSMSLAGHLGLHGPAPLARSRGRGASELIEQVERAGLRGHGGAGFPTATKMRAVASARGRPIVVINAAEGEPASRKDRTLTQSLPHLVLDGGELAAHAIGAHELIVCVCESAQTSFESLALAISERVSTRNSMRPRIVAVPDRYVTGQESALVSHLNGGAPVPTFTPPMIFERGVARRPTLLSNAETLAHIALIARHGSHWFRQLGTASQPGSALLTLSGSVAHPGVYEIEYSAPLVSLLDAAGGVTSRPRAALLGGYSGCWVGGEHLQGLLLADEHLVAHGASFGAGVILLLSEDACPVAEVTRAARWLAGQSAGQCGPCVHGLDAIAKALEEIAAGRPPADPVQRIERLAALVRRRGACGHPDGAAGMVLSALQAFKGELVDHARYGPCDGCRRAAELPLPDDPHPSGLTDWGANSRPASIR